ncbi:hypothetical protein HK098_006819, partial [Nowakowskiella sp. JEL0407]
MDPFPRSVRAIYMSEGPKQDPRNFYSTIYSTTHNTNKLFSDTLSGKYYQKKDQKLKVLLENGQSKQKSEKPSQMIKQRTGYTKNVVPFVEYDKNVDEGDLFRIEKPFESTHTELFKPPKYKTYVPIRRNETKIEAIIDSGFTRKPKSDVTKDGSSFPVNVSTTKDHYVQSLKYKPFKFDKSKVIPSASAYINDIGHIENFGTDTCSSFERPKEGIVTIQPFKPNVKKMQENAYTKSSPRHFLKQPQPPLQNFTSMQEFVSYNGKLEKLRRCDLAGWVGLVDPLGTVSTSRVIQAIPKQSDKKKSVDTEMFIGTKEATGSVRNNPDYLILGDAEINNNTRFITETSERFKTPPQKFNLKDYNCDLITRSGFSHNNKFKFTAKAPLDEET